MKVKLKHDGNVSAADLGSLFSKINLGVRRKLDEVKRMEVEYQRDLIRKNKNHMAAAKGNEWSPIHMDNKDTFTEKDLHRLLQKKHQVMEREDAMRRKLF